MAVCFTGHRDIHGIYFNSEGNTSKAWQLVWERTLAVVTYLAVNHHQNEFIAGGAIGFDTVAADVICHCKYTLGMPINLTLALPFKGYDSLWPVSSQRHLAKTIAQTNRIIYVNEVLNQPNPVGNKGAVARMLQKRNEVMVNRADTIVSMYIPDKPGGTLNCLRYVMNKQKPFYTINPDNGVVAYYTPDKYTGQYQGIINPRLSQV